MYVGSQQLVIPQLAANQLDVVLRDGSQALTADWDAGSFQIRAETFQSDVATGTAPLVIASTTLVTNLNADLLDGQEGSYYRDASNLNAGTLADARVAESNVTQHQAAIDHGSIAGLGDDDHTIYVLADGSRALSGDLSAGSNKITNLATPSADADAATKGYVDATAAGLKWKESVRVATTANGALATAYENGDTVDGVVLATGDRILLKNQSTGSENGIYVVQASGAPTRSEDLAASASAAGVVVFVEEGSANADQAFVCTSDAGSDVVGTDSLAFAQFGGSTTDHGSLTGLSDDDHTQYLRVDGTRVLSANWDAGSHQIRAETFQSDVAPGTAPFTVASATVVTNLNADYLDGNHASAFALVSHTHSAADITSGTLADARVAQSNVTQHQAAIDHGSIAGLGDDDHTQYLRADGFRPLSSNWDVGSFQIRARTFYSDVSTGTAPFTVVSTTLVNNLNADQVDGIEGTALVKRDGTTGLTADWDAGSHQIRAETFQSDVATGTAPLVIASTTLVTNLNADTVDGYDASTFLTPGLCQGRLTLATGDPAPVSDQSAKSTLYFTPFVGNKISLYDTSASAWVTYTFSEASGTLTGLTADTCYDVFAYWNSGSLALEWVAWTNSTTRATALAKQDGVYVKSGDASRLYVGTFYAETTTTTNDSGKERHLWNYYNRLPRQMVKQAEGSSATYSTASTWRAMGNDSNVRLYGVVGLQLDAVSITCDSNAAVGTDNGGYFSIGENSTSSPAANHKMTRWHANGGNTPTVAVVSGVASLKSLPEGVGLRYWQGIEQQALASPTVTFSQGRIDGILFC